MKRNTLLILLISLILVLLIVIGIIFFIIFQKEDINNQNITSGEGITPDLTNNDGGIVITDDGGVLEEVSEKNEAIYYNESTQIYYYITNKSGSLRTMPLGTNETVTYDEESGNYSINTTYTIIEIFYENNTYFVNYDNSTEALIDLMEEPSVNETVIEEVDVSEPWSCFEKCNQSCNTIECRENCVYECERETQYKYMTRCDNCLLNTEQTINKYYINRSSEEIREKYCYKWYLCSIPEDPWSGVTKNEYDNYANQISKCGKYFINQSCPDIDEILNPGILCNPDWICTEGSDCINHTQTKECYDRNECNQVEDAPKTVIRCAPCYPQWSCTSWSECINGVQTRECTDLNNCDDNEKFVPEGCDYAVSTTTCSRSC